VGSEECKDKSEKESFHTLFMKSAAKVQKNIIATE
jgi:hypothetical protein